MSMDLLYLQSSSRATEPAYSLHHAFKYWPSILSITTSTPQADACPPLQLRHLGLNACLVRLDHIVLPHLRHLQSIHLQSIIDPYDDSYPNNINNGSRQRKVGSSIDEFWRALASEEVWVEEIVHEDVGVGFLDYLELYPTTAGSGPGPEAGLKSLTLSPDPWHRGPSYSNPLAGRFFSDRGLLIKHAKTLEKLLIKPRYEGDWCFDVNNLKVLAACANLKAFGMSVISGQIPLSDDGADMENIVVRVLSSYYGLRPSLPFVKTLNYPETPH